MTFSILGTVQLGLPYGINNLKGQPSKENALEILKVAREGGIEILDTARAYGTSYDVIQEFHKKNAPFEVLTKFHFKEGDLETLLDQDLKDLKVDRIHTYSFHAFQDFQNFKNFEVFEKLKKKGKILNLGVSLYSNSEFQQALDHPSIDTIQIPFNLLDNYQERGALLRKARQVGKKVHVRSIYLQGLFFKNRDSLPPKLLCLRSSLRDLDRLCESHKVSLKDLAFSYPWQFPEIEAVLWAVEDLSQLRENLDLIKKQQPLSEEVLRALHRLRVEDSDLLLPKNWT